MIPTVPVRALAVLALLLGVSAATVAAAPSNDHWANRFTLQGVASGTNREATLEAGEGRPCGDIGATVWWSFTPRVPGVVEFHTKGSNYDTVLAVWNGAGLPLNFMACNDDFYGFASSVSIVAQLGTTYHLQVGGYGGSGPARTGDILLHCELGAAIDVRGVIVGDEPSVLCP